MTAGTGPRAGPTGTTGTATSLNARCGRFIRSITWSIREGCRLGRDAPEVHLEVCRILAVRLARPGPRHRRAARQRHDAVVVADEGPDAVGAAGAGDAVGRRVPARLGDAGGRPRPTAIRARDVRDIEQ